MIRVYSTSNCACIAELRRGIDQAVIFDLAISPGSRYIAVTSDKSTLHVFDLPRSTQERATSRSSTPDRPRGTTKGSSSTNTTTATGTTITKDDDGSQKWGILGKIPLMPRVFSDTYSFASAPFEIGDESTTGPPHKAMAWSTPSGGSLSKGIIGWTGEKSLVVVGAGREGRWERFIVGEAPNGRRFCVREGWRRYLGGS